MEPPGRNNPRTRESARSDSRVLWTVCAACLVLAITAVLLPRPKRPPADQSEKPAEATDPANTHFQGAGRTAASYRHRDAEAESQTLKTAGQIVADKVSRFAQNRREIVRAAVRPLGKQVPPQIQKLFHPIEAVNTIDISAQ